MKLSNEERKKIGIGFILLIGLGVFYFTALLGPLAEKEKKNLSEIAKLEPKIKSAQLQIKKTAALEKKYPPSQKIEQQLKSLVPDTSPVAWFPPKLTNFFSERGVQDAVVRLANDVNKQEFPGFRKMSWTVQIPKIEALSFSKAIADLENQDPLLAITGIQITTSTENVQYQQGNLTVQTFVK